MNFSLYCTLFNLSFRQFVFYVIFIFKIFLLQGGLNNRLKNVFSDWYTLHTCICHIYLDMESSSPDHKLRKKCSLNFYFEYFEFYLLYCFNNWQTWEICTYKHNSKILLITKTTSKALQVLNFYLRIISVYGLEPCTHRELKFGRVVGFIAI